MRKWIPFGSKLLYGGKLSDRHREMLILRTAQRWESPYEWGQHVLGALSCGMTSEDIDRIRAFPAWDGDDFEACLLRAVDELHDCHAISDATWEILAEHYNYRQLIELTFVVGHYGMLAYFLNSARVRLESGLPSV